MLYFAYGSNLDETQMRNRCANARPGARAVLADHALVFGGTSKARGGAVANVLPAPGGHVDGRLYELDETDLRRLDRWEGYPKIYDRIEKSVRNEHGRQVSAFVYLKPAERCPLGAPHADYYGQIRAAYERLGFDLEPLERAAGLKTGLHAVEAQ